MTGGIKKANHFFKEGLWELDLLKLSKPKSLLVSLLRGINAAFGQVTEGQLTLRAMSLVYTTLLSIVPVFAISFSVLKAFGVHNEVVEPFLLKFLAPLGAKGEEITATVIGFVENMKVGVLGSVGLAMLFYTVISVIQKVEVSFNSIWKIKKSRNLARRFSDYISVLIVGPVMIFTAMGLTASLMSNTVVQSIVSIEPFGTIFYFFVEKIPYIIVCGVFTFLYMFIPNTKVRFKAALIGGVVAGILWESAGWAFASFVVSSTKYAAIYSGFAILIMFMIWLYVSWLILLVGAQISFYIQYPLYLSSPKEVLHLSNSLREKVVFLIMYSIGYNYYNNERPWTVDSISTRLELPVDTIEDLLGILQRRELITETADDPPAYLPAKDLENIRLNELYSTVRVDKLDPFSKKTALSIPEVDRLMKSLDDSTINTLGKKTLRDLIISSE